MIQILQPFAERHPGLGPKPDIIVYNGSASAADLTLFKQLPRGSVRFRSTTHDNKTLLAAVRQYAEAIMPRWAGKARYAMLTESNTGFGQQSSEEDMDSFAFPLNISQIREEYASKGYLGAIHYFRFTKLPP